MKKLIALTLIVVCLGCFSLGCGEAKKTEPVKPAGEPAATDTPESEAPASEPVVN